MARNLSDFGIILPELHPGQIRVKKERKSRTFLCAHRGWRKSSLAIDIVVEHLLDGENAAWYAPTMKVIETSNWIDFRRVCRGQDGWFNKSEQTWTIPGKGTCFFFSMEKPANVRGGTFSLAILEEMGEWADGVFESYVEPVINKVGGDIFAPGTPNVINPNNDFYKYVNYKDEFPDEYQSFVIPAYGADLVDGELIEGISDYSEYALRGDWPFPTFEHMKRSYERSVNKERWQIEYLCKFISANTEGIAGVDNVCTITPRRVDGDIV